MLDIEKTTYESDLNELRTITAKRFEMYHKTIALMCADAPISVLCLKKSIENKLVSAGYSRVYDLLSKKFVSIDRISVSDVATINASIDQFISI